LDCRPETSYHVHEVVPVHPVFAVQMGKPIHRRSGPFKKVVQHDIIQVDVVSAMTTEFPTFLMAKIAKGNRWILSALFAEGLFWEVDFHSKCFLIFLFVLVRPVRVQWTGRGRALL
jgi:hypothetical protein